MMHDQLATFTDRLEAIALFNMLRGRDPDNSWPLLPILAFVAPGGSGKSLLLRHLRLKECSVGGRAALPYAYLDFTLPHTPKDLLSILMELRNQLQQLDDGQGNHLLFPRFDLGALIAQAASSTEDVTSLGPTEVRQKLEVGMQIVESLGKIGSSLRLAVPYIEPLIAGLQLAMQIKPLKDLLSYLEDSTGWKWYRMHGSEIGLGANATMKDVLLRLHVLSMPGKPERDSLVNEFLPSAFIADLFDALLDADPPRAWSKAANIVLFMDGYEALQNASKITAMQLLQVLTTTEQRKKGNTDPLLLVVGSREYLPGSSSEDELSLPFRRADVPVEQEIQLSVQERYTQWQQHIPPDKQFLRLKDLYLTLELQDFGQEDTRSYLSKLEEQKQTQVFAEHSSLVLTIDRLTYGHPLYLALAAEAVFEAQARGRNLTPGDFELAEVSPEIAPEHEDEHIRDYLLNLFLGQLPETERKELIFCAVPRFLDVALLRVILPALDDIDRQQRWEYYQHLTFMRLVDRNRIVFHPLVRTLLLRQLPAGQEPESDYYRAHTHLRDYFHDLTSKHKLVESQEGEADQAKIEEAYHALALGDPDPAITLGVVAQQGKLTLWGPLLEAVAQAPIALMPDGIEQQASNAVVNAEQYRGVQQAVKAIILYTWLLAVSKDNQVDLARTLVNLGNAYNSLPEGDRNANLRQAIACYEAALQVYTREDFPVDWALTQSNLGLAYTKLPAGDLEENLRRAIECQKSALQVYTREAFPDNWAKTQINLGYAYSDLPGGDREENLGQAIACYEAASQVYTREAFPVEWAMTQSNLGEAYRDLPAGDREANLGQAIAYFNAALQTFHLTHAEYYADKVNEYLENVRDELQRLKESQSQDQKVY